MSWSHPLDARSHRPRLRDNHICSQTGPHILWGQNLPSILRHLCWRARSALCLSLWLGREPGALLEAQDVKRSLGHRAGSSTSARPCNLTLPLGDVGAQEASGEAEGTRLYCTCQAAERPVNFGLKMGGKNLAATVQQRHRAEWPLGSQVAGHGEASRPVALPPPYWQRS